jgi:hypothetical protein
MRRMHRIIRRHETLNFKRVSMYKEYRFKPGKYKLITVVEGISTRRVNMHLSSKGRGE